MADVNENLFDKRIIERNIAKGLIKREDYEKYLGGLKKLDDELEYVTVPHEPAAEEKKEMQQSAAQTSSMDRTALQPQSPTGELKQIQNNTGRLTPIHDLSGSILEGPVELANEASQPQPRIAGSKPVEENEVAPHRETAELPPFNSESKDSSESSSQE